MRGLASPRRTGTCVALIAAGLLAHGPAAAQSVPAIAEPPAIVVETRSLETRQPSWFAEVITRVAKDPTTYALPPIVYTAHRLDWDSSQKVFPFGYNEGNPKFTITGLPSDVPVSHAEGNRRILKYAAKTIGNSIINNAACAIIERRLIERAPHRRKLIRTLGWIERTLVASYWSYHLTHNQMAQWRLNERLAGDLRARQAASQAAVP